MPNYNFRCEGCNSVVTIRKKISEISDHKETCNSCLAEMHMVVASFSSSVKMDKEQKSQAIKEEAKKIAEKVRSGDQNLISQIYGEK